MAEEIRQGDIPGVQLRYRHRIHADPGQIWPWLTRTDHLARWLASSAETPEDSPGTILLTTVLTAGEVIRERLSTVHIDPPDRWVLDLQRLDGSWPGPTRVDIEVSPTRHGSEISILQTGFAHLPLSDCLTIWESYRRRWRQALTTLASRIDETPTAV